MSKKYLIKKTRKIVGKYKVYYYVRIISNSLKHKELYLGSGDYIKKNQEVK